MAIDQWGRVVPDYTMQGYRDELLKQRDAINYRLSEVDKRYQAESTPKQAPLIPMDQSVNFSDQTPKEQKPLYTIVTSEKEAYDYPIINKFDDEIGKVHFFVMNDESAIFAKRINRSTFDMEFEAYDRRARKTGNDAATVENINPEWRTNIDSRVKNLEDIVNNAVTMFMGGKTPRNSAGQFVSKTKADPQTPETTESEAE